MMPRGCCSITRACTSGTARGRHSTAPALNKTVRNPPAQPGRDLPASLAKVRGGAFYLHGDDEFRKEEVVRALIEAHLDPATRDFNYDPLRGTELDAETLASVLGHAPDDGRVARRRDP